jgi:hypothetical protein
LAQLRALDRTQYPRRRDGPAGPRLEKRRVLTIAAQLPPQHESGKSKHKEREPDPVGGYRGEIAFGESPKAVHLDWPKRRLQRAILRWPLNAKVNQTDKRQLVRGQRVCDRSIAATGVPTVQAFRCQAHACQLSSAGRNSQRCRRKLKQLRTAMRVEDVC